MRVRLLKEEHKVVLALFSLSLVLISCLSLMHPIRQWDEAVYLNLGHQLSKNPFDYSFSDPRWTDWVPGDMPKAGFRPPVLPYTLAVLCFFGLDLLSAFLIPVVGALSAVVIYFLAKAMFNKRVALYSSVFLLLLPVFILFSQKVLTDVFSTFLISLAIFSFWLGFEKGSDRHKVLFGALFALSILSRYAVLFILPAFPLYLILRNRGLSFMRDKFVFISAAVFFLVISPWLIYGISEYGNPLGPFMHGMRASNYFGGAQPWYFFAESSFSMFSVLSIVFAISLAFIATKKNIRKNHAVLLLLLWFLSFFILSSAMAHKEERYILPLVPPVAMISALFVDGMKRFIRILFVGIVLVMLAFLALSSAIGYQKEYVGDECFLQAAQFLQSTPSDSVVATTEPPIVFYYSERQTALWNLRNFSASSDDFMDYVNENYYGRPVYVLFTEYSMNLSYSENTLSKSAMDSRLQAVYRCPEGGNSSVVYKIR
jgi:4-amino-4-deoxy-L-arabinose transferase-like glycosyltransferase